MKTSDLLETLERLDVFYDDSETRLDVIFERSLDDYLFLNDFQENDFDNDFDD